MFRVLTVAVVAVVFIAALGGSAAAEWPVSSTVALEDVRVELSDGKEWCDHWQTEVHIHWTLSGNHYAPYAMTIGGWAVDAEAGSVSFSCVLFLWLVQDELFLSDGVLRVPIHLIDAVGGETAVEIAVPVVASAPSRSPRAAPSRVGMVVGTTELFVQHGDWPVVEETKTPGVFVVPIARYRPAGEREWDYFVPLPGPPQNSSGGLPQHVTGLEAGVLYELQTAYAWYTTVPGSTPLGWRIADLDTERWWRASNDPLETQWSETWQFRTIGAEHLTAEATADAVTVSWTWTEDRGRLDRLVGIHRPGYDVIVRSDQWPNVIWGDGRNNIYGAGPTDERSGRLLFSSTISGLPPETEFEVAVQRRLPSYWPEAPAASILVRTERAIGDEVGVGDPRDVVVELVDDRLIVRWTSQEAVYDQVALLRCAPTASGERHCAGLSWDNPIKVEALEPRDGRTGASVGPLTPGETYRLYFNRRPSYRDRDQNPFMCIVWDINVPPIDPDAYFDRYFRSAYSGSKPTIVPANIPPLNRYVYEGCAVGDTSGP